MALGRRAALQLIAGAALFARPARATAPARVLAEDEAYRLHGRLEQGGWALGQAEPHASVELDGQRLTAADDGAFFLGFDRDCPPVVHLAVGHGRERALAADPLTIAPRAWQIEQVDAPLRPPAVPSDEFLRLRQAELARIAAARALVTGAQGWRQTMRRPVPGRVSGRFGAQRIYRGEPGAYHSGLDLAAPAGTPILAPADGVVILAADSPFTLEGKLLMLDHGMGLSSALLHCSAHAVREGDAVRQGQPVASVGMTGRATGPHLHWGLRWHEARLDPLLFLDEG